MKKISLILLLSSFLFSCGVQKNLDNKVSQCYVGMSVPELKNLFGKDLKLVSMKNGLTVYSLEKDYTNWMTSTIDTYYKFFYFRGDGKLFQMDEGQRATDYKLEIK